MTSLVPARMLNELVYCKRLFALEYLDGEWAESADTVRGARVHKRVDRPEGRPDPDGIQAAGLCSLFRPIIP